MKYISKETIDIDDINNLSLIPSTKHKHINIVYNHRNNLKKSYVNYLFFAERGLLKNLTPNSKIKADEVKSFIEFYKKPKGFPDFITEYRRVTETSICYMCGSMQAGTLDHFLPKELYPEFSFFSKNLIPCCNCNSKKGIVLSSELNPHFFKECDNQLFSLNISNITKNPDLFFEYKIVVANTNINKIVANHLKEHILSYSGILNYMKKHISLILNNPTSYLAIQHKINKNEIINKIQMLINVSKMQAGSENRWDVILHRSLLEKEVLDFIKSAVDKAFP